MEGEDRQKVLVCSGGKIPRPRELHVICSGGLLMLLVKEDGSGSGQVPGE